MKLITNWRNATVGDVESDGLLDIATKLHVLSFQMQGKDVSSINASSSPDRIVKFFNYHIENSIPVVFHNGIWFDIPLVEKLYGIDLSKLMVIDSLALSWYLNVNRKQHGLDSFFEDYGIAKPKVDDWENLSYEEYKHRCQEDVKINKALWEDFKERLVEMYTKAREEIDSGNVGGKRMSSDEKIYLDSLKGLSVDEHIDRILTFLMFKCDCAILQEKTRWEVDVEYLKESEKKLKSLMDEAAQELEGVMPPVPQYSARKRPAKPFKKNGELSSAGLRWEELKSKFLKGEKDEYGNLLVKGEPEVELLELTDYKAANINSVPQVKDFLMSKGWEPQTFKYDRDQLAFDKWVLRKPLPGSPRSVWDNWSKSRPEDRAIPQITRDGEEGKELCPSIIQLSEEVPEIRALENYSMIKHRYGMAKGFLENLVDGKYLRARINGFTNTLRVKHAEVVNLPKAERPFAEAIRGSLIAGSGKVSLGADLSGIEDRVKHHFMLAHDPEYVSQMLEDGYDPHLATAVASELITAPQAAGYKMKTLDEEMMIFVKGKRALGKTVNYSSVYGVGAKKLARTAKITEKEAQEALDGYWKLNWSVKAIADEQVIVTDNRGLKWLINPINGHLYSLRSEKDIFSTLCQGTGSYFFDMWVDSILTKQKAKWGRSTLTGSFHDEVIIVIKDNEKFKSEMSSIIIDSIQEVSNKFIVRRKLECEVQVGYRYSEIH